MELILRTFRLVDYSRFATFANPNCNKFLFFFFLYILPMSTAHAEHAHADISVNPAMKWFGIAGALATAICMTIILEKVLGFPRTASGVLMGVVGIPMGAFSNSNASNPNGQAYMEWFGFSLFLCSLLRFLHVSDILAKMFTDSPMISSLITALRYII
jgi:hypothetical protein